LNYTGALNYRVTNTFQAYARYTNGQKAPDFGGISAINTATQIALNFPEPQRIQQVELGLKYNRKGISLQAFPFYSKLSNVGSTSIFIDDAGIAYSPPALFARTETYGVELQANARFNRYFNLDAAVTIQDPQSKGYRTYVPNAPTRADDSIVAIPDGDAENNPKLIVRTTGTYTPVESVQIFGTYSYLGKRAANQANAWYLPGFSTVDLGASWNINDRFKIQFNVNNVLNNDGVYSWARSGGLLTSLQRQTLTKADIATDPNQLFYVIPQQPRSFFLVGSVKF
ncbi:MAG: TonB-dependent receptor, partial [Cytophagaceae bacterium]